eukprot:4310804-Amphidinium_carterae.1
MIGPPSQNTVGSWIETLKLVPAKICPFDQLSAGLHRQRHLDIDVASIVLLDTFDNFGMCVFWTGAPLLTYIALED